MKSIKTKLILYFGILILLISSSLGFLALQRAGDSITWEAEKGLQSTVNQATRLTESRVETQQKVLDMIAGMADIQSMDWEFQQPVLQKQLKNTNFLALGIVYTDGKAYYTDGTTAQLGDRDYVKKAFEGKTNVSELIISRVTNEPVLMYAAPIKKDGKVVGVLIGRRDGNALSNVTNSINYGENGYAYMINDKGIVIGHPDKQKVLNEFNPIKEVESDSSLQSLASLFTKILKEQRGISTYHFEGNDLYAAYEPIKGTNWILVITANEKEVLSAVPILAKNIIILTVIILMISIGIIYVIGNSITKPIIGMVNHSDRIANLDIAEDVPDKFLKSKDEVGRLAIALQTTTNSLREIISEINRASEQVTSSSEELTATAQQSSTAAEEVARTVEEIARGASEQAKNTEDGTLKGIQLGETIEKDQTYMEDLNESSQKVSIVVNEGLKEIEKLTKISDESRRATNEVQEGIIKTNDSAGKIGQASTVIASIAEQTNLLALNAAIEAARAGDAGRGFAVVAEEIRKLAEQSTSSTQTIDEVVSELQSNSKSSVETMERVALILKQQEESVDLSKEKYMIIAQAIKESERAVEKLNVSGIEMNKMKDEIMNTLQNLSAIAEENSAATEQASASMEEQTASMEEISSASEGLSSLAQDLQTIIMKFKV